eukprot:g3820.t1
MRNLLQWLRDESFIEVVAEWSWDVCMEFPRDGSLLTTMEHPLRYTEAHEEYRQLFEARADQYLQYFGLEMETRLMTWGQKWSTFILLECTCVGGDSRTVERTKAGGQSFEDDDDDDVFEGLVASESYSTFFTYMCSVRRRREWAERTMCSSRDSIDWSELMRQAIRRDLGDVTVGDDSDIECLE